MRKDAFVKNAPSGQVAFYENTLYYTLPFRIQWNGLKYVLYIIKYIYRKL